MKPAPAYSTYIRNGNHISHHWLQSARRGCIYLENYVSRALLQVREMLISLFDDAGVSDLGECDSFYGGREPTYGRVESGDPWTKGPKGHMRVKKAYRSKPL